MLRKLLFKLQTANPWHFLWISVLTSEIFTFLFTVILSILVLGRISSGILLITAIDAFLVPLLVAPLVIYFIKHDAKLTELNELLQKKINDQKKTETKLIESEERYRNIYNTAPLAFVLWDTECRVTDWNKRAEKIFGWSREEILGQNFFDFIIPASARSHVQGIVTQLMQGKLPNKSINENITKSGQYILCEWNNSIVRDAQDNIIGALSLALDITKRRQAEELLFQISQDWEDTFNAITDVITIHDKDYNIIRANKAAEKMLELPNLREVLDVKCFKHYHGTDGPPAGCPSCDCLRTGRPATFEIFEPHLNLFIEIRAIARFNKLKEIVGLIHVVRDITERVKIETSIRTAKIEWETTFDSTSELIVIVDRDGKILRCNKSFAEFVDKPIQGLVGRQCSDLLPVLPEQLRPGMPETRTEVKTEHGDWLYISYCPIVGENNQFLRGTIICTDITDLKYTQDKLRKSEEQLQSRVEELEKFYEMAVGRELKMRGLKAEIRTLQEELSQYKK